jgi:hypothetical protein
MLICFYDHKGTGIGGGLAWGEGGVATPWAAESQERQN